jgi:hypothetical protein
MRHALHDVGGVEYAGRAPHRRIRAYVLMIDHVHLLVTRWQPGHTARMMQALKRGPSDPSTPITIVP